MIVTFISLALLASPGAQDQADKAKADRTVCKVDRTTGSRLEAKRICKKQSEWATYYRDIDPNNRAIDVLGLKGSGTGQQSPNAPN